MQEIDADFYARAIISLLVITSAFDPVKILFFNEAIKDSGQKRVGAALKVASTKVANSEEDMKDRK